MRFCRTDNRFANAWRSKAAAAGSPSLPSPRPPELLHVSLYNVEQSARISDAVIFAACRVGVEMRNLGEDARINRNFQPHATRLYDSQVMPRVTVQTRVVVAAREFVLLRNRPGDMATSMSIVGRCGRKDNGLPRAIEVA
ncbi:hypothetical protein K9B32_06440 [Rhizobium sp. 3T7]|uniref:hypothetical protein n=1 Tax=Rhizobium sp. 3T7 TaxID=2874922 RepID=UPI001CC96FEF|nr:hypothetical protein [Rhizobium sp. 3T7]MBZ9789770.1 hypothetical protein [Rhizobium sp. 3T7]